MWRKIFGDQRMEIKLTDALAWLNVVQIKYYSYTFNENTNMSSVL